MVLRNPAPNNVGDVVEVPSCLGNNVYLFEPDNEARSREIQEKVAPTATGPSLIIMCTWLGGATTSRVTKYTSRYRTQYPDSYLLLIRTVFLDISARSFATIRARLQPARETITKILRETETATPQRHNNKDAPPSEATPDVLLHIFSHGGCNTAIQLATSLHDETGPLLQTRLRLIVFDSCPGDASFDKAYNAALVSLPRPLSGNSLGVTAAYSAVALITALQSAGLMRSVVDLRRELNDPALFGTRTRRVYLVSRGDRIVAVEDVISHAREGKANGYEVGVVAFPEAPHCGLIMEDAERYWVAIRDCWEGKELPVLPGQQQADYISRL